MAHANSAATNTAVPRVINGRPCDPITKRPFARHFTKTKIQSPVKKLGLYPIDAEQACSHSKAATSFWSPGCRAPNCTSRSSRSSRRAKRICTYLAEKFTSSSATTRQPFSFGAGIRYLTARGDQAFFSLYVCEQTEEMASPDRASGAPKSTPRQVPPTLALYIRAHHVADSSYHRNMLRAR